MNKYDNIIDLISKSKKPIETALNILKVYGREFLLGVFVRTVEISKTDVSNYISKAIIFDRLYRVNLFLSECQKGNADGYLSSMSLEEKMTLAEDYIIKIELGSKASKDVEYLTLLNDSINKESLNQENKLIKVG